MKTFESIFYMLTGNTLNEAIDKSMFPNLKCSVNEIIEKTKVTKADILILLEKGVIKGEVIFGVPYIIGLSAYGVENKLKEIKKNNPSYPIRIS